MTTSLRLVSYNIHGARRPRELAQVVRALRPDVLVANETPKQPLRWRRDCDRTARQWGLVRAGGGRDAGSTMICVSERLQVVAVTTRRLRQPRFAPRRGLVSVRARVGAHDIGVVGVHLSLSADGRPGEVAEALRDAAALPGSVVVAGDLNERPSGPSWRTLADAGYVDHSPHRGQQTFPSHRPDRRIDAVLLRPGVHAQVVDHRVVSELPAMQAADSRALLTAASDHLPVVLDLHVL